MTKDDIMKLALEAFGEIEWSNNSQWQSDRAKVAITAIKEALAQPEQEPKCGAIIEVFGKDWRLEYLSLPVGKHKLYTQQYTYTTPEQEPVGQVINERGEVDWISFVPNAGTELYASPPPQRTWVGLTEKDICEAAVKSQDGISPRDDTLRFAKAIEAKLKEKNA